MHKRTKKAVKGLQKQLTSSSSSSASKKVAPLEIQLRDAEESLVLERLANSLQWQTKTREVNVTVGASTSSCSPASTRHHAASTTTTTACKNDDETQWSLLFATIGELPLLTDLTIQTQQTPTSTSTGNNAAQTESGQALKRTGMRMSDVTVCLQGTSKELQSLKLSDVTLNASRNGDPQQHFDEFIDAITRLTSVRHLELHRCMFEVGANTSHKQVWDRILGACATLPLLESLHLTAMPTVYDDCQNELSPLTLQALYNNASHTLRDLQLNGDWNIQACHIQALKKQKQQPVASKLEKMSLGCRHWNTERIHALSLFVQQQSSLRELYLTKVEDSVTKMDDKASFGMANIRNATTTPMTTSPLTVLIQSLAHTQLTHVGLMGVNASELRAVPRETWSYMWDHNCVLQHLEAPSSKEDDAALTEQVRADNLFWLNLNKAGRSYLSRTDQVHPDVLLQVLSHPNTNDSVQALYYFLSATHPCLISSS